MIDWAKRAEVIERSVRGFQPWPNAYTSFKSKGLTIWNGLVVDSPEPDAPAGEVIAANGDELVVSCGEQTALRLLEGQPEARKRIGARDLINGMHLKVGDRFGKD